MAIERVWLHEWEWACCGDPFRVGDDVTLMVDREITSELRTYAGDTIAATLDAVESHHEEGGATPLVGTVRAVYGVVIEYRERRVPRVPRPPRRPPMLLREPSPGVAGFYVGAFRSTGPEAEYAIVAETIPGTARLLGTSVVPWEPSEPGIDAATQEGQRFSAYVVDVEVS